MSPRLVFNLFERVTHAYSLCEDFVRELGIWVNTRTLERVVPQFDKALLAHQETAILALAFASISYCLIANATGGIIYCFTFELDKLWLSKRNIVEHVYKLWTWVLYARPFYFHQSKI